MAIKDIASKILQQIESGTEDIYKKYESLVKKNNIGYEESLNSIDKEYEKLKNDTESAARIDLNNSLTSLADKGLLDSGRALHTKVLNTAGTRNAVATLDAAKTSEKNKLKLEKAKNDYSLETNMIDEVNSYRTNMYKTYISQLEKDRNYEQKLITQNQKSSTADTQTTIKPAKNASNLLEEIIKTNTKTYKDKGYKVINRSAINRTLQKIINDTSFSKEYRYELEVYAKVNGYLS